MRSFLRFLIFITVLVAALVVVGGPLVTRPLIAALVRDALPFDEDEVTVGVDVGPALFAGEVEVVSVSGRDLDSGEATIGLLEVTVTGLSIVDRSFRDIDGRLEAVELRFDDGTSVSFEHIEVSGPSNALRATATLDEVAVERLVLGKLADQGIEADAVRLGDEQIEIDALGMTETARLSLRDGGVFLDADRLPTPITLFEPDQGDAWVVTSATVSPASLAVEVTTVIEATLGS